MKFTNLRRTPGYFHFLLLALFLAVLAFGVSGCASDMPAAVPNFIYDPSNPASPPARPELVLEDSDRILVLAPHPDDEILATGGLIQQAIAKKLAVRVVFLTNGDNNEFAFLFYSKAFTLDANSSIYAGQVRAFEALRAGRELGLQGNEETFLGYPDFGTLEIWQNRWGDQEAFRSMFSEQSQVPYWFARTPDSPYKGESILGELGDILTEFKPTKVFVSHPADTNPDHISLNLFLHATLWDIGLHPNVYAYLTHYGAWPQPRGLLFDAPLEPPSRFDEDGRWVVLPLKPEQTTRKLDALKRHKTQYEASREYLESYMRTNELFDVIKYTSLVSGTEGMILLPSGLGVAVSSALPSGSKTDGVTRQVHLDEENLFFTITLDSTSAASIETDSYAFGYRSDQPFGDMPKIHVEVKSSGIKVTERRYPLQSTSVQVERHPGQLKIVIPLELLNYPERLFFTASAKAGNDTLDPIPWVILEFK